MCVILYVLLLAFCTRCKFGSRIVRCSGYHISAMPKNHRIRTDSKVEWLKPAKAALEVADICLTPSHPCLAGQELEWFSDRNSLASRNMEGYV